MEQLNPQEFLKLLNDNEELCDNLREIVCDFSDYRPNLPVMLEYHHLDGRTVTGFNVQYIGEFNPGHDEGVTTYDKVFLVEGVPFLMEYFTDSYEGSRMYRDQMNFHQAEETTVVTYKVKE